MPLDEEAKQEQDQWVTESQQDKTLFQSNHKIKVQVQWVIESQQDSKIRGVALTSFDGYI